MAAGLNAGPVELELFNEFASFTNASHPDNRIGYRFHEHTPIIYGEVPQARPVLQIEKKTALDQLAARPGAKVFHRRVTEDGWVPQDWTFYLVPVAN